MMGARVLVAFLAILACASAKKALHPPPYAIAHRGLSGVYPEHTLKAYRAAISAGADFIECDVVPTKDCKLICRHEPDLSGTTNALALFPELKTTYNVDGADMTGVFSFNLTLAQVKTLRARQSNVIRNPGFNGQFEVPTLVEYIQTAQAANRVVGIYPETKHPTFHDSLNLACFAGTTFTQAVLDVLTRNGYTGAVGSTQWRKRPAFLQSFERKNLIAVSKKTDLPLVFLADSFEVASSCLGATHCSHTTRSPACLPALPALPASSGTCLNNLRAAFSSWAGIPAGSQPAVLPC